jgi:hypothetical protein
LWVTRRLRRIIGAQSALHLKADAGDQDRIVRQGVKRRHFRRPEGCSIGLRRSNERPSWFFLLGWWSIVERLALIDDVHRQKLYCLIANNLEGTVRNISNIHSSDPSWDWHLLAVR